MRFILLAGLLALAVTAAAGCRQPGSPASEEAPMAIEIPGPGGPYGRPSRRDGVPAIRVQVTARGTGQQPARGNAVSLHYTGTLTDGTQFDSSRTGGRPFTFRLGTGQVIAGWDLIVAQMRVGDRWVATIPHQLAYGDGGYPGVIPPRAALVFDMELVDLRARLGGARSPWLTSGGGRGSRRGRGT